MVNNDYFLHLFSLSFLQIWILESLLLSICGSTVYNYVVFFLKNVLLLLYLCLFYSSQNVIFKKYLFATKVVVLK